MTSSERPNVRGACEQDQAAADPPLRAQVRRTHADPVLRRLMLMVTLAVVLGMIGTAAAVVGATQTRNASRADVQRAADLTTLLANQQQQAERRSYAVRTDTRTLLEAICHQIEAVRDAAPSLEDADVPDCPVLPPVPEPVGEPDTQVPAVVVE